MKTTGIIALFIAVLAGFSSCKKDDIEAKVGINGVWTGNYTVDPSTEKGFFSLNFKSNGVLEELSSAGAVKGTGTWEMDSNNIITGSYKMTASGNRYSIVGAFYPQQKKVLGNWGYDDSATDGGTYELSK
ncbi:hypothetical protein [Pollutibacter soli]|uniref:hypothetical protein n=1 Tax=Pollutibacter soli TaxID=3034157 RepID=UPI003014172C